MKKTFLLTIFCLFSAFTWAQDNKDTDGDGVLDKDDLCPTVPGLASNKGCPVKIVCSRPLDIFFVFDSAELTESSYKNMKVIIELLKEDPDMLADGVYVDGHTDRVGSDTYNKELSLKRAQKIATILIDAGIDKNRLIVRGFGKSQLHCTQDFVEKGIITQEGCDQENRRVEFVLVKQDEK